MLHPSFQSSVIHKKRKYGGLQSRVRCGVIYLIALFVASSDQETNQERGASK